VGTPKCPKYFQLMDEGFIVDYTRSVPTNSMGGIDSDSGLRPAVWVEGRPLLALAWLLERRRSRKVATFCCPKCGFLESYAETGAK
jgi:hypothetical protein